jgi:hypothetical protein
VCILCADVEQEHGTTEAAAATATATAAATAISAAAYPSGAPIQASAGTGQYKVIYLYPTH